jgi:hypothetical protein
MVIIVGLRPGPGMGRGSSSGAYPICQQNHLRSSMQQNRNLTGGKGVESSEPDIFKVFFFFGEEEKKRSEEMKVAKMES